MDIEQYKKLAGIDNDVPYISGSSDDKIVIGLLKLLAVHKKPTKNQLHQFIADSSHQLNISHDALEEKIIAVLLASLGGIGKHNSVPDSKFNSKQLKLGIATELEHTKNKEIAKLIAKDHLVELPNYYTRLRDMEKQNEGK